MNHPPEECALCRAIHAMGEEVVRARVTFGRFRIEHRPPAITENEALDMIAALRTTERIPSEWMDG